MFALKELFQSLLRWKTVLDPLTLHMCPLITIARDIYGVFSVILMDNSYIRIIRVGQKKFAFQIEYPVNYISDKISVNIFFCN